MHIMLDLETLSSQSNAAVISIGAVAFDFNHVVPNAAEGFHAVLDTEDQVRNHGRHISRDTMLWWGSQSEEARVIFKQHGLHVGAALSSFAAWVERQLPSGGKVEGMWGNGATFDNVILSNLYEAYGFKRPWPYYADRCYRTIKNITGGIDVINDTEFVGVEHNALHDAVYQARVLVEINKRFQLFK